MSIIPKYVFVAGYHALNDGGGFSWSDDPTKAVEEYESFTQRGELSVYLSTVLVDERMTDSQVTEYIESVYQVDLEAENVVAQDTLESVMEVLLDG